MSPMAPYPCDLHTHTLRSDGNDTVKALIDAAADVGILVLAITDHDIIAPTEIEADGKAVPLLDYGLRKGVAVLPGIEFSCDTQVEDVHLVALGCDFAHPFFAQEYEASIRSKIHGYKALCRLLSEDGMALDWQRDILLDGVRAETSVQRKQLFEAMAQKGYAADWSHAKVLIQTTPRYSVKREKPDPIHIIQNVHLTGGIAIMAHPFLVDDPAQWQGAPISRAKYIEKLIAAGLDGIEAPYPYDKTSYKGTQTPGEIESAVCWMYGQRLAILSGGSDYHNEGKKGAKNPRLLGEKGVRLEYFLGNPRLRALLTQAQLEMLEAIHSR